MTDPSFDQPNCYHEVSLILTKQWTTEHLMFPLYKVLFQEIEDSARSGNIWWLIVNYLAVTKLHSSATKNKRNRTWNFYSWEQLQTFKILQDKNVTLIVENCLCNLL